MTGAEMKSELMVNARVKGEVKLIPHHRRKLSKGSLLNCQGLGCNEDQDDAATTGNVMINHNNVNLAAAFHDHMSCTKSKGLADQFNVFDNLSTMSHESNVNGDCHNKQNVNNNAASESERLKELLLINLKLIKQQNEIILAKNQQIEELKSNQITLEDKIKELQKQILNKKSGVTKLLPQSCDRPSSSNESDSKLTRYNRRNVRSYRRRNACKDQNLYARKRVANDKQKNSLQKSDDYCTTDQCYFVNDFNAQKEEEICVVAPPTPDKNTIVQVPSWRINPITSLYSMEGTENLDDDVFLKRHSKSEIDERRRKRWDIQRIRELRKAEKLKLRYDRANEYVTKKQEKSKVQQHHNHVTSLCNNFDDVKFIQVDENIYVNAFSQLIPSFTSEEFSIPFYEPDKFQSSNAKKNKLETS